MGMGQALCKDSRDDPLGLHAGGLVQFHDYTHPLAGVDLASVWYWHNGLGPSVRLRAEVLVSLFSLAAKVSQSYFTTSGNVSTTDV